MLLLRLPIVRGPGGAHGGVRRGAARRARARGRAAPRGMGAAAHGLPRRRHADGAAACADGAAARRAAGVPRCCLRRARVHLRVQSRHGGRRVSLAPARGRGEPAVARRADVRRRAAPAHRPHPYGGAGARGSAAGARGGLPESQPRPHVRPAGADARGARDERAAGARACAAAHLHLRAAGGGGHTVRARAGGGTARAADRGGERGHVRLHDGGAPRGWLRAL